MKHPKLNEVFTEQDNGTTPGEDEQPEVSEAASGEYRKPKPGEVMVLENDGHNEPKFHIFRDMDQACDYIDGEDSQKIPQLADMLGDFEDGNPYEDDDGTMWTVTDGLYTYDHTKDTVKKKKDDFGDLG